MSTKHTPEPWKIAMVQISGLNEPVIMSGETRVCTLPALTNAGGRRNVRADAIAADGKRITACVNACAGLNPSAIQGAVEALSYIAGSAGCRDHERDIARQALAALKQGGEGK